MFIVSLSQQKDCYDYDDVMNDFCPPSTTTLLFLSTCFFYKFKKQFNFRVRPVLHVCDVIMITPPFPPPFPHLGVRFFLMDHPGGCEKDRDYCTGKTQRP